MKFLISLYIFGRFLIVNAFPVFTPIILADIFSAIFVDSRMRFTFDCGVLVISRN